MRLKNTVRVNDFSPQLVIALLVAKDVYQELGYDFELTSCNDGGHSLTSLHYAGEAFDGKTNHMTPEHAKEAHRLIRERLTVNL